VRCRFVTGVTNSSDGSTGVILAAEALRFTGMVILYKGICAYVKVVWFNVVKVFIERSEICVFM
jgi:hypothetical protein